MVAGAGGGLASLLEGVHQADDPRAEQPVPTAGDPDLYLIRRDLC